MFLLRLACLIPVATVGLRSQTVLQVGPGGFAQIRAALAIAAPGDIVHIAPGTYAHFDAAVGVTLRALVPGTVAVQYDSAFFPAGCPTCVFTEGPTRLHPPTGQSLHVIGIHFVGNEAPVAGWPIRHRVEVNSGRVTFDGCTIETRANQALAASNASLHLRQCIVQSTMPLQGGNGVTAQNCTVTAIGSRFAGGSSGGGVFTPGRGFDLAGGILHASHCEFYGGGFVFPAVAPGAPAVTGFGQAWISDSVMAGGCAIQWDPSMARLDRCTLTSTNSSCAPLPPTGFLLGVDQPSPLQLGAPFPLHFHGQANGFVAIFASTRLGRLDLPGLLEQPSWLDDSHSFFVDAVLTDTAGQATISWSIPVQPSLADLELWFKGISGFTFPLQASPPTGGIAR